MKVNFFTPLPPSKSGISDHSIDVANSLNELCDLTVYTYQYELDNNFKFKVINLAEEHFNFTDNNYDKAVNFLNIGNNAVFHKWMLDFLNIMPAYSIVHDLELFDLIFASYTHDGSVKALKSFFNHYYFHGRGDLDKLLEGKIQRSDISGKYRFLEYIHENSLGLIAHSEIITKYININRDDIGVVNLAYTSKNLKKRKYNNKPPYNIVMFGYISFNRMWEEILKAFSKVKNKKDFRLKIFGELQDKDKIKRFVKAHKLNEYVEIRGFLNEQEMSEVLSESDICFNLRNPTMGESSYSLLKLWDHEVASVVSDTGWYSTLPNDCVVKMNNNNATEEILNILNNYSKNKSGYNQMAKLAKKTLKSDYNPDNYARYILKFAKQNYKNDQEKYIARKMCDYASKKAYGLFNSSPYLAKSISNILSDINFKLIP